MEIESIIISAFVTIFAFGLFLVSLLSYKKFKNSKLIFVSLVFIVLFIRGILMSLGLFYNDLDITTSTVYVGLVDLIIIILLFIATLKR